MKILIVTEQREGRWNNVSFEALTAARQIGGRDADLVGVIVGSGVNALAEDLAGYQLNEVITLDHALLEKYTPDGFTHALRQLIAAAAPDFVIMPHTYQVRDFAPKLAASLGRGMIGDCIGHRFENGRHIFVRQMFQGKTAADVVFAGEAPWIATFQASAFRGDMAEKRSGDKAPVRQFPVELKPEEIRLKPGELFREAKQAVDLAQVPVLVSVGRGIKAPENIAMAEKLAKLLGGEICASRPICDEGWLPMDRQIGSSGQTVAPKLYLALGISGAIQHVVGMKGSRTIVAVNKDQNAPIFEIADYGVVGDIFEIIPALTEELQKNV
jgi:electron transfer flavoprotein alpha subunit